VLSPYWLHTLIEYILTDFGRGKKQSCTRYGSMQPGNYLNHHLKKYFGALHLYYPNDKLCSYQYFATLWLSILGAAHQNIDRNF